MERFQKYYLSLIFLAVYSQISAQVNCSIYTDENCRKACEISNQAGEAQGFALSQMAFDKNGDYNLYVAKAICYSALNKKDKAIQTLENLFKTKDYHFGLYDYYQLGVTYFETAKYDKALENFEKQSKVYDFAENIYFKSKVSKIRNKDYLDFEKSSPQNL